VVRSCDSRRTEAERYLPEGQAIMLPHVRALTWRAEDARAPLVEVGPERTFRGRFGKNPAPPDSKAALSTSPHFFEDGGGSYPIAHGSVGEFDKPVEMKGRLVELSPFSAHIGGPHLWLLP
jgi:hypothetical protein